MSEEARRVMVSVPAELIAEAERLVAAKRAVSVEAVVHDVLQEYVSRDRAERGRRWLEAKAAEARAEAQADPEVAARRARTRAHVDEQLRRFDEEHRRP